MGSYQTNTDSLKELFLLNNKFQREKLRKYFTKERYIRITAIKFETEIELRTQLPWFMLI